jgi:hypothetical protein
MESHQRLHVFLPKLRIKLMRCGMSNARAGEVCNDILELNLPGPISTASAYQRAWVICDAMEEILTNLDDGSEAAAWCLALAHRIFEFEDSFRAKHGYMPLNPAPRDLTDGPTGNA